MTNNPSWSNLTSTHLMFTAASKTQMKVKVNTHHTCFRSFYNSLEFSFLKYFATYLLFFFLFSLISLAYMCEVAYVVQLS